MKKYSITLVLVIIAFSSFAQHKTLLIRHDTTLLRSDECEWIVKSLIKNDPSLTAQLGKSIPLIILQAIQKGKLKAYDRETNQLIPGKEIFTWQMPSDTVSQFDKEGNMTKYIVMKQQISSDMFSQFKVYQDWHLDISTGKIECHVKWIELMQAVSFLDGTVRGYKAFCRIYY